MKKKFRKIVVLDEIIPKGVDMKEENSGKQMEIKTMIRSRKKESKKSTIRNEYEEIVKFKNETVPIIMKHVRNIESNENYTKTNLNDNMRKQQPMSYMKY